MRPLLTVLILSAACNASAQAHSAHSQVTEVEWNSVSCRFEIAMKLDAVALEDSVSALQGKRFRLESPRSTDAVLQEWMEQSFHIEAGNSPQFGSIRWVAHELQLHTVWLYFEYLPSEINHSDSASSEPKRRRNQSVDARDICIENKCLLDVRPETIHFIKLRNGQSVLQGHCSHLQPVADFSESQNESTTRSVSLGLSGLTKGK
jgi:hypothetical protein